jgi:dipeptidyl aminopeptidase/acylaminoacyl peptidase
MKTFLLILFLPFSLLAQQGFEAFKKYPFPTELTASAKGAKIAWAMDEEGRRNVYVAEGPSFTPRKLTNYVSDDGQEITSLQISDDGKWVVFVRGGDHGSNWEGGSPVNPTFELTPFKVQIASIPFDGGDVKYLAEGDAPIISPDNTTLAFTRGGQAYTQPVDGSAAAKPLFTTRGSIGSLQWSPNGNQLLFVSNRTDHSIIGIFTKGNTELKWIAPSYHRDQSPRWSEDGRRIVFIRTPGSGGAPDSILAKRHNPWSIYIADASTGKETMLWKAPTTLRGSTPNTHGRFNLHWASGNQIVFLSYMDGWPHLYSINAAGGQPLLLTPGNFMCEHIVLSPDKKSLLFSANTGTDQLDIERRHVAKVSVDKADMQVLTHGSGLEWTPVMTGDGKTISFISATATRPPLPAIFNLGNNQTKLLEASPLQAAFPLQKLVTPKQVIFKAADGMEVHADLFEPIGGAAKKPAIIYVHGGPPRQMLLGWNYSDYYSNAYAANQYLASLGFVVLSVNYRLGIGYGYDFHNPKNGGASGASEYQDIKAAGEWLQKQPNVAADKIGIYGGSYGGFLTALALAKDSKLFAAGVDIHGVHDWVKDRPAYLTDGKFEKAPDIELAMKTAWASSPVAYMDTWKSPVLIIHGDDDRNVRFNQSVDLIQRLEKHGIPHETMMIVDDTHHWMKHSNAVKVYEAVAEFFVRKFR